MPSARSAIVQTALIAAIAGVSSAVFAADGTWIATPYSQWDLASNWKDGIIADGPNSTAYFTQPTGGGIVEYGTSRTLGSLDFGYAGATDAWRLLPLNGASLSLDDGAINVAGDARVFFDSPPTTNTLTKTGTGKLTLNGGFGASSINIAQGTLEISASATSAPISNNGILLFARSGSYSSNSCNIAGTGRVEVPMMSTFYLDGTTTHTGGTSLGYNSELSGLASALRGSFQLVSGSKLNATVYGQKYQWDSPITGTGLVNIEQPTSLGHADSTWTGQTVVSLESGNELWLLDSAAFGNSQVHLNRGTIRTAAPLTMGNALTFGEDAHIDGSLTFFYPTLKTLDGSLTFDGGTSAIAGKFVASISSGLNVQKGAVVALRSGFSSDGAVAISSGGELTVGGTQFTRLGGTSTIRGILRTPNGATVPAGGVMRVDGAGEVSGRFAGGTGSNLLASGAAGQIGDPYSLAGFYTDGELFVEGASSLTLRDKNQASLGSLTTLGLSSKLIAANGIVVEFGRGITGFGLVESTNSLDRAVIINGTADGNSAEYPLEFSGYVKGAGTFNNVLFSGTFSPGLSPTSSLVQSIALASGSTLLMELGGTVAGLQHDQLNIMTSATLGGTLQIDLINGYSPKPGDEFTLFVGNTTGTFQSISLPALQAGVSWNTSDLYAAGTLSVVPEPSVLAAIAIPFMILSRRLRRQA